MSQDLQEVPRLILDDGVRMPAIGFGTSGVRLDGRLDEGATYEAVRYAIEAGYRFIDTAALYMNESSVGLAIQDAISAGVVKREELFICSKVWNTAHKRQSVVDAFRESLERLRLDYLDLYLIHWPMGYAETSTREPFVVNPRDPETGRLAYSNVHFYETWLGLEDLKEMGLVLSIGLSNFNHEQIEHILTRPHLRFRPSVLQVELHPYFAQFKLQDYCNRNNIVINAYCPLGAPGASWLPADQPKVIEDAYVKELSERHQKTPAQIILRWLIERRIVPIPKSDTPARIRENLAVFDFSFTMLEMQQLDDLDKGIRCCTNTAGEYPTDHPLYPFHAEY